MIGSFFDQLIDIALEFMRLINLFSDRVIWFMFSPIADIYSELAIVGGDVAASILNTVGLGQYSIFTLMLTAGVVVYLAYQLLTWLFNLVT